MCQRTTSALLLCGIAMLAGCTDPTVDPADPPAKPETTEPAPAETTADPVAEHPGVYLVAIHETNTDSFAEPLAMMDIEPLPPPPFELVGDRILVRRERPAEDDWQLTLGGSAESVSDCRLLIVRTVSFVGTGRLGRHVQYYAFPGLEATLPLPPPIEGGPFEYDPRDDVFAFAIESVRLFPPDAKQLSLSIDGGGQLTVSLGSQRAEIATAGYAQISSRKQTIHVVEKELIARVLTTTADDPFGDRADPEDAGPPEVISSGFDHGQVTFGTTMAIQNVGSFPLADDRGDEAEDL